MGLDLHWLTKEFQDLSKRFPELSLVVAMRPGDIESVEYQQGDLGEGYFTDPSPLIHGKFSPQGWSNLTETEIAFPRLGEPLLPTGVRPVLIGLDNYEMFPEWNFFESDGPSGLDIWSMWLHRTIENGSDEHSNASAQRRKNIACLNAFSQILGIASQFVKENVENLGLPPWMELSFQGNHNGLDSYRTCGPWLLFLSAAYSGGDDWSYPQDRTKEPIRLRVFRSIGLLSVLVLQRIVAGQEVVTKREGTDKRKTKEKGSSEDEYKSKISPTLPSELQEVVNRFRFAASEFRDIRTMPDGQQSNLLSRKITDLNGLTQSAWKNGGLLSIDGLVGKSEVENLRSFFMFSELVGYTELQSCADLPDEYFLWPGLLSKYSSVFQTIHVGNKSDIDIEDVGCAWEQHRFEILGYYSHACEVIAKILESEVAESCGVDVGAVRLELPPMPNGRNPQRLIQCFWREADWKVMPPRCTARTICREIWPEESKTDIEFLAGSRLKKTLSDTNSKLCEMNVRITFRKCGDYIEMDDYRE